jgi:hypothetical protein
MHVLFNAKSAYMFFVIPKLVLPPFVFIRCEETWHGLPVPNYTLTINFSYIMLFMINHWKVHSITNLTMSNSHYKNKKLIVKLLVKDDQVIKFESWYTCAPYEQKRREYFKSYYRSKFHMFVGYSVTFLPRLYIWSACWIPMCGYKYLPVSVFNIFGTVPCRMLDFSPTFLQKLELSSREAR